MNKLFFLIILVLTSCSNDNGTLDESTLSELKSLPSSDSISSQTIDSGQAKIWLEQAIKTYFQQEINDMSFMTTAEYNEYKIDMMNSPFSHGIELDSLKKKWSHKYEVTQEKANVGFLINAQDYFNITIKTCMVLPSDSEEKVVLKLILCDTGYDKCHESDVTVIEYGDSYAIDDVEEHF